MKMERILCSVEHLNITNVPMVQVGFVCVSSLLVFFLQECSSSVAVCKHFCGSATDSGIRCLLNAVRAGLKLNGFVLVPCCHHKSRYEEV